MIELAQPTTKPFLRALTPQELLDLWKREEEMNAWAKNIQRALAEKNGYTLDE